MEGKIIKVRPGLRLSGWRAAPAVKHARRHGPSARGVAHLAASNPCLSNHQGEARGGLLEVTRKKEDEIARREAEIARR